MEKLGLCFSGGGIKAFAHIGVLKALEERNIKFDCVAGTSSGSIIAVLYAMGYRSSEIYTIFEQYIKKVKYIEVKNMIKMILGLIVKRKIVIEGLNSGKFLEKALKNICKEKNIYYMQDIKMPVIIPAVNLKNGEVLAFSSKNVRSLSDKTIYITDIEIWRAVKASCSFPAVFSPCMYKGKQLSDGGIRENIAWRELKYIGADKVLGINFETELEEKEYCENMIEIAVRAIKLMERELASYELSGIDELITIKTKKIGLLDTSKVEFLYEKGYKEAKRYFKLYKNILLKDCHK